MAYYFKEIKEFMKTQSSFTFDGYEDGDGVGVAIFITRENGDVGAELYGQVDYIEAKKLCLIINDKYKGKDVKASVETCDEWVYVNVIVAREPKVKVKKTIYMLWNLDEKGCGGGSEGSEGEVKGWLNRNLNIPYEKLNEQFAELRKMKLEKKYNYSHEAARLEFGKDAAGRIFSVEMRVTIEEEYTD